MERSACVTANSSSGVSANDAAELEVRVEAHVVQAARTRVLGHAYREQVVAALRLIRHVNFKRRETSLMRSHPPAVELHLGAAVNAIKAQLQTAPGPSLRYLEVATIATHPLARLEAFHDPVRGNVNRSPIRFVEFRAEEVLCGIGRKLPGPVQMVRQPRGRNDWWIPSSRRRPLFTRGTLGAGPKGVTRVCNHVPRPLLRPRGTDSR
jgi:hypothetical protein